MNHYVTGVDRNGVLKFDIIVSGSVPELPVDSEVYLYPYTEDYIQTGPSELSPCRINIVIFMEAYFKW